MLNTDVGYRQVKLQDKRLHLYPDSFVATLMLHFTKYKTI